MGGSFELQQEGTGAAQTLGRIFRQVWMDPLVQRFCWVLKPFISSGSSARNDKVWKEEKAPSLQLCPVAQVEILGQCVVMPSPRFLNGLSARCLRCR